MLLLLVQAYCWIFAPSNVEPLSRSIANTLLLLKALVGLLSNPLLSPALVVTAACEAGPSGPVLLEEPGVLVGVCVKVAVGVLVGVFEGPTVGVFEGVFV